MKNFNLILFLVLLFCANSKTYADLPWSSIPRGYRPKNNLLIISTKTPPALLYLTDGQGRRAGINPNYVGSLDQYGQLTNPKGFLCEIPLSSAEQQNVGNPQSHFTPGTTSPSLITILDGATQTYTINLLGITNGVQRITVKDLPAVGKPSNPRGTQFYVFVQPNVLKQVQISVDTSTYSMSVTPVVDSSTLLNDVESACSQKLISRDICDFLEEKARRIERALNEHRKEEAKRLVESFLCNLGQLQGQNDDDRDCHQSISEPALTALINDAKALLKTL